MVEDHAVEPYGVDILGTAAPHRKEVLLDPRSHLLSALAIIVQDGTDVPHEVQIFWAAAPDAGEFDVGSRHLWRPGLAVVAPQDPPPAHGVHVIGPAGTP